MYSREKGHLIARYLPHYKIPQVSLDIGNTAFTASVFGRALRRLISWHARYHDWPKIDTRCDNGLFLTSASWRDQRPSLDTGDIHRSATSEQCCRRRLCSGQAVLLASSVIRQRVSCGNLRVSYRGLRPFYLPYSRPRRSSQPAALTCNKPRTFRRIVISRHRRQLSLTNSDIS
ncbi:hypothetical protein OBBRIDRAFT_536708 [Obba rivulosa]|uniref:Uncharacterized protein n=1 Tax=Obba rivulosa TaxID=1052685 RepID=A0A8E2DTS0_9APHY|nr:hypothetical protein OBBRIDRAFT_536708 [Obba rivulosa]